MHWEGGVWYLLLGLQAVSQGNELGLQCIDPHSYDQCRSFLLLLAEKADTLVTFRASGPPLLPSDLPAQAN